MSRAQVWPRPVDTTIVYRPPALRRAPTRRLDLEAEDGFGIIEVLVSALIVVILSLGLFAAIDAAGRTADTNKGRSAASNLASGDQDRLRALPISTLAGLDEKTDPPVTVDNKAYTVRSQGAYDVGKAGSDNCASNDEAPRYLKMTSTVTWNGMKIPPVKQDSLRAIPNRSLEGLGSLAVDIDTAAGPGLPDTTVTISGPKNDSQVTNSEGCVIFGFIPTGTYTITFSRPGYITPDNPGKTSVSEQAVVAENTIASKSFEYDRAGAAQVNYQRANYGSTTSGLASITGNGFTIANTGWGVNNTKSFTANPSGAENFPFTGAYQAWAGRCAQNKPTSLLGSTTIPPGGTGPVANVRLFRLQVKVQRRTSAGTSTTNYATMPNDGKTTVRFYPAIEGCTPTTPGYWVSNYSSGSSATAANRYSIWEGTLPWGQYHVCVAYKDGSNDGVVGAYSLNNTTASGSQHGSTVTVPHDINYSTCPD